MAIVKRNLRENQISKDLGIVVLFTYHRQNHPLCRKPVYRRALIL